MIEIEKSDFGGFYRFLAKKNLLQGLHSEADVFIYDMGRTVEGYTSRSVRRHLEKRLLPCIALYKGMLNLGITQKEAIALLDEYVESTSFGRTVCAGTKGVFHRASFSFGPLVYREMENRAEGYEKYWVCQDGEIMQCNITSCLNLNVLKDYKCPELTPVFCKEERARYLAMSVGMRFTRPHTLADGDAFCDFKFEKE